MKYSKLLPGEIFIDDDTKVVDTDPSHGRGRVERDYDEHPFGSQATPFNLPLIARSDYKYYIEKLAKTKATSTEALLSRNIPSLNQSNTNFCWVNGVVTCIIARRAQQGSKYVSLSPGSVAAPINNYRNLGGWGSKAVRYIQDYGICTTDIWPANAYSRSYNTPESQANRAKHKVKQFVELQPRNFAQLATMLLNNIPVAIGLNWWRHEVAAMELLMLGSDTFAVRIRNSWGDSYGNKGFATLSQSKATPDDAVCPYVLAM